MSEELINSMVALEDENVLNIVKSQLKSRAPMEIFEDLRKALLKIGILFDSEEYFLSDLIIAADIFKEASKIIEPYFPKMLGKNKGKIVVGTVEGDMHDIGKNIIITMLKSEGYDVIDLGIDVSPEKFLKAVIELKPSIVGLSGLLTSSKIPMEKTIKLIKKNYEKKDTILFVVGGVAVNEDWIRDIGADFGTNNAVTGLKIINEIIKKI
jgi:5-methyltetrahydrofolate--homocysteine methyltransferase